MDDLQLGRDGTALEGGGKQRALKLRPSQSDRQTCLANTRAL